MPQRDPLVAGHPLSRAIWSAVVQLVRGTADRLRRQAFFKRNQSGDAAHQFTTIPVLGHPMFGTWPDNYGSRFIALTSGPPELQSKCIISARVSGSRS